MFLLQTETIWNPGAFFSLDNSFLVLEQPLPVDGSVSATPSGNNYMHGLVLQVRTISKHLQHYYTLTSICNILMVHFCLHEYMGIQKTSWAYVLNGIFKYLVSFTIRFFF